MTLKKKRKVQPKPPDTRIYLTYNEISSGGEIIQDEYTDMDSPFNSREDSYIQVEFECLYRMKPEHRFFYDSIEVNPKEVDLKRDRLWMGIVRYYDGDTFGRTNGRWHITGLYNSEKEAYEILKSIESDNNEESRDYSAYKPWQGYFAGLESTQAKLMFFADDYRDWQMSNILK